MVNFSNKIRNGYSRNSKKLSDIQPQDGKDIIPKGMEAVPGRPGWIHQENSFHKS